MKFCPNCGTKVPENSDFCPNCGQKMQKAEPKPKINEDLSAKTEQSPKANKPETVNVTPEQIERLKLHKQPDVTANSSQNKGKKIALGVGIAAIVLAAVGMSYFTIQSSSHHQQPVVSQSKKKSAKSTKDDETIVFKKNNTATKKKIAGIAIAYADMKYDDKDWSNALDNISNGEAAVHHYSKYEFGDYEVEAPKGGTVYAVSPNVGFVLPKSHKTVTFVASDGTKDTYNLSSDIYSKVKEKYSKSDLNTWAKNIVFDNNKNNDDKSDSSASDAIWDNDKEDQLAEFMNDFGDKMDQDYTEYNGEDTLKTDAGQKYPDIFSDTKFKLNGKTIDIGWNPGVTGKDAKYDYNVVSIFNYDEGKVEFHITYLFCFHNGKPVVLVDQTTNGNDVAVEETANKSLKDGFAEIAAGRSADDDDE